MPKVFHSVIVSKVYLDDEDQSWYSWLDLALLKLVFKQSESAPPGWRTLTDFLSEDAPSFSSS